ncbi:hypothetical protein HDU87_002262 [Geranomyces variabilis]|uniref:Rab-GAP TBC domain-containing protein n=1 Tax=Geranomyces variabilis TaxID=109894 RepID=A0AAD5TLZ2_9FUNG|nr:hypothetical protein HDU87_002262 [Geranomyces variabilis]
MDSPQDARPNREQRPHDRRGSATTITTTTPEDAHRSAESLPRTQQAARPSSAGLRKRTGAAKLTKSAAAKQAVILEAIADKDLVQLRKLAGTTGGYLSNSLRREVWPILLHCSNADRKDDDGVEPALSAGAPVDANQVELDVARSLCHMLPPNMNEKRLTRMRRDLSDLILSVLKKHPYLRYYQGYHDVATVLLLVLKPTIAASCLESLSLYYIRDFMTPTLQSALNQIHLLFPLLSLASPKVHTFLSEVDGFLPYFCLSWVITWYSHNLHDQARAARLFDFLIASNPLMPVYLAAAVVLARKTALLTQDQEYSTVHHFLSQFPLDVNVEALVRDAQQMYTTHPPNELQKIAKVRLGKSSCVTRYAQDMERLAFTQRCNVVVPQKLVRQHTAETSPTMKSNGGGGGGGGVLARGRLGGQVAANAKQVAWIAAFAVTTALALYAYEIGMQYGYLA